MGYYTADTVIGVSYYGKNEPPTGGEEVTPENFYLMLKDLPSDRRIYANFEKGDLALLIRIEEEYGIH